MEIPGPASEPAPLPTPAVLSDAVKAAQTDVEEALRQDRTLERQRDWTGAVGVFQGVGARLFAVSVAKLLLLAAVLAADASFIVWLMGVVTLAQAFAIVFAADVVAAAVIFAFLLGRGRDQQHVQTLLNRRPFMSIGLLERALQHTLLHNDGAEEHA